MIQLNSIESVLLRLQDKLALVSSITTKTLQYGLSSRRVIDYKKNGQLLLEALAELGALMDETVKIVPRPTDAEMVDVVKDWFNKSEKRAQEEFRCARFEELITFHHNLGQQIRNHFKLWMYHWEPEIVDGIDMSKEHPDAVSQRIIEKVWREVQE